MRCPGSRGPDAREGPSLVRNGCLGAGANGTASHRHVPEIEWGRVRDGGPEGRLVHAAPRAYGAWARCNGADAPRPCNDDAEALGVLKKTAPGTERFVQLVDGWPHAKALTGTNVARVGASVDARARWLVCSAAIDNLGKGAAGQAFQNVNLALGLDEHAGLEGRWGYGPEVACRDPQRRRRVGSRPRGPDLGLLATDSAPLGGHVHPERRGGCAGAVVSRSPRVQGARRRGQQWQRERVHGARAARAVMDTAWRDVGNRMQPPEVLVAPTGPSASPSPWRSSSPRFLSGARPRETRPTFRRRDPHDRHAAQDLALCRRRRRPWWASRKGAAMIAPNMATMLAFVVTDARVADAGAERSPAVGRGAKLRQDLRRRCESTNDSVYLLSTGRWTWTRTLSHPLSGRSARTWPNRWSATTWMGRGWCASGSTGVRGEAEAVSLRKAGARRATCGAQRCTGATPTGAVWPWHWVRWTRPGHGRSGDLDWRRDVFSKGEPSGSLDVGGQGDDEDELTLHCVVRKRAGGAEVLTTDLSTDYVA